MPEEPAAGASSGSGTGLAPPTRRTFLLGSAAAVGAGSAVPRFFRPGERSNGFTPAVVGAPPDRWLGPDFWANRFQDWLLVDGRICCVADSASRRCRTVSVLTKDLSGGAATLRVRTGTLQSGTGFSGFLVGTGTPGTDYRRAALVVGASGAGGGLLAVYGSDGVARFRRHDVEANPFGYPKIPPTRRAGPTPSRTTDEDVQLTLGVVPASADTVTLTLEAVDTVSGQLRSRAVLRGVARSAVTGGVALVSSGAPRPAATYWFQDLSLTGSGVEHHPKRSLGPIVGTLFSLTGTTLKMTAQLVPLTLQPNDHVRLQIRKSPRSRWVKVATATVGPGYAASLRVDSWTSTRGWDYRVTFSRGGTYSGHVPAEPVRPAPLTLAVINCTKASHRGFDRASSGHPRLPGETELRLYSSANAWFPHEQLASAIAAHQPDVLVALGDQFYEDSPTLKDTSAAPELDFMYKYLLWLWSFRQLTRNRPCYVIIDDHDVYQGNLFGEGGVPLAPTAPYTQGGYVNSPDWINVVQRVQCGHNPDPPDPAPVAQGIGVYFTAFKYGGVQFALLEDRKFKSAGTGKDQSGNPIPPAELLLLGPRQEAMLRSLAHKGSGPPGVVLTQTLFGCLETSPTGAIRPNRNTNGWPPIARLRALRLVKGMHAVMVSGDTHLPALVRHGIKHQVDGPLQFSVPAGATSYQRWFEPSKALPNGTGQRYTGDLVDGHGNRMRVLAVRNMHFTQQQVLDAYGAPGYGHREFKQEGYGILRVDFVRRQHTFEAWRWDVDPSARGAAPMAGWPVTVAFDKA